jgi:hypothetical protein
VDLRCEIDPGVCRYFITVGFERSFGIVSGQDPMGQHPTLAENERLAASLQQEVSGLSVAQSSVTAFSPDGSHCEKSVAIALDLESLIALADRYRQLAIFWFDGDSFWIIPVRSSMAKLRLPITV